MCGDQLTKRDIFSQKLTIGIILASLVGVALFFRIILPFDQIFRGDSIKLTSTDAYHYMRLVDNLVHNFPNLIPFDPYLSYPQGFQLGSQNLFVYLISGITWLIGMGSPSQHFVDVVGVYFPAIVGALTIIPVYFVGKAIFNRWAGVIASGLVAIYPGEFMGRSILGFAERDTIEVLFTVLTMLFLILAIKSASQTQLSLNHLKSLDWPVIARPFAYSLLSGIFLGFYLLTWTGAFLFLIVIFVYFVIQHIVDHLNRKSTLYLGLIGTIIFLIAMVMFLPASHNELFLVPLIITLLTPVLLSGVSWLMAKRAIKPVYYPLLLLGLGSIGLVMFNLVNPSLLRSGLGYLIRNFVQSTLELTTSENAPLLFPSGDFSLSAVWLNFTTSYFLALLSLGVLIYLNARKPEADRTLFLVWSLVILLFTLAMRRFAVFLTMNVALLTGYLAWLTLRFTLPKEKGVEPFNIAKKAKGKRVKSLPAQKTGLSASGKFVRPGLAAAFIFLLVFFPNIGPAASLASRAEHASSDGWVESLSWLKANTPDPFDNADFYYDYYQMPFHYPETAYAVLSWWDYGYEIIRTGHRIPSSSPGGGSRQEAGRFFTSQDEGSADEIIKLLNARYILIDGKMVTAMFPAMATYAGSNFEEFFEVFYERQGNMMSPVPRFYPEYYRSLAVRLYAFDGRQVTPERTTVISYQEKVRKDGKHYKEITSSQVFAGYEEAKDYISHQPSGNYKIVGTTPFISPVPLEALKNYRLVYGSKSSLIQTEVGEIPDVKVFEYTK